MTPARPARRAALVAATALLLALRPARAAPSEPFALAARVPASTLAFARVPSPRAFLDACAGTAAGRVARAPDVAPFLADVEREATAFLARARAGHEPACPARLARALEVAAALEGDVQVALLSVDADHGPRWVASLDFGPRVAAFVEALEAFAADGDDGLVASASPAGGVLARPAGPPLLTYAIRGSVVVATNDPAGVEAYAAAVPRPSGSLADTGALTSAGGAGAQGALATAVADPGAVADQAPALAAGTAPRRLADALGLSGVLVLGYRLAVEGDDLVERVAIRAPGREARLLALAAGRGGPGRTRAEAAAQAAAALRLGIAPADLLARAAAVAAVADEDVAEGLDATLRAFRERAGADLATCLAPLADDLCLWVGPSPQGGLLPDVGLAVAVRDREAFDRAVARAAPAIVAAAVDDGAPARRRELPFRGVTLHVLDGLDGRPGLAVRGFAFARVDDVVLVAPHAHGLREAVARHLAGEPSLAARPDPVPAGAVAALEIDLGTWLARAWDTWAPFAQTTGGGVPFPWPAADAPPTRVVAPGLRPLAAWIATEGDGLRIDARGPLPVLGAGLAALAAFALRAPQGEGRPLAPSTADPAVVDPERATDAALAHVAAALEEHAALAGGLPATLDDLRRRSRLVGRLEPDGWGRALRWRRAPDGRRGTLRSDGADGAPGTDDDRTVEVEAPPK